MTTPPITPPPLDAASIRTALTNNPEDHGLTPESAQTLIEMSDDQLNAALVEAAEDTFWEHFSELCYYTRCSAIESLIATHLATPTDPEGA